MRAVPPRECTRGHPRYTAGVATLPDLLSDAPGSEIALLAPTGESSSLTYNDLRAAIERLAGQLRGAGVGPGHRVAIALPNGPEAAIVFLAAASCATAAPLNPQYRAEEFRFYLGDLDPRAVITRAGNVPAGLAAVPEGAVSLSLEGKIGALELRCNGERLPARTVDSPAESDVALVLHTSGTTARPKLVPLTHANLIASALNVAGTLGLEGGDRCLNVMPLFHIHGLVASVLASLAKGGSVACSPGFDAFKFFDWLVAARPTWYTAVPTMHQVIAARSERRREVLRETRVRFARSSSAALPLPVLESIESCFCAPMLEAYGMTEASHQVASNPRPPAVRKPGSVGLGGGVDIAIMDQAGARLAAGERGEVAIRGENVFRGYHANPEANAASFVDGWFRTGDEGYLDSAGYLSLTGRLKEMINRGGEKVAPAEVEDVLLRHPAVAQAVVFAIPHRNLGEDVGAAVVLAPGQAPTARQLRHFASEYLSDFKLPATVVFLDELPKGPTGKLQRIGLAARLGIP
ncbi:MAG: AMP-binding protein [Chloroflexi bacterium]|nr:AMP-binding protein [Chloroflexota bacterium]